MKLNSRDRAKVNAALVLIRDQGHDVSEVTRVAEALINSGTPPRKAYERGFNKFVERVPTFHAPLQRLGQLIEASDHQTLAKYNVALSRYIETGEASHLQAVMPTVQQDMATMAQQTGDAGIADGLGDTPARAPATAPPAESLEESRTQSRPGHTPEGYRVPKVPPAPTQQGTG